MPDLNTVNKNDEREQVADAIIQENNLDDKVVSRDGHNFLVSSTVLATSKEELERDLSILQSNMLFFEENTIKEREKRQAQIDILINRISKFN